MGSLVGHVAPGSLFFFTGLWHLFNHIKLYILHTDSYTSLPWFPFSKCRHLELLYIMVGSFAELTLEFVVGMGLHPFDPDGTIPFSNLNNFEHSLISASGVAYTILAIALDRAYGTRARARVRAHHGLTSLLFAMVLAQQVLILHHHSVGGHNVGPEGQYHSLLVLVTLVTLIATLTMIIMPRSFVVSFVRSLSMVFIGVWFFVIGVMLWTPQLIPKGCFFEVNHEGNRVVRCSGEEAIRRANSLVNLQFGFFLIVVLSVGVSLYLVLVKIYGEKVEYFSLKREFDYGDDDQQQHDVEPQEERPNL